MYNILDHIHTLSDYPPVHTMLSTKRQKTHPALPDYVINTSKLLKDSDIEDVYEFPFPDRFTPPAEPLVFSNTESVYAFLDVAGFWTLQRLPSEFLDAMVEFKDELDVAEVQRKSPFFWTMLEVLLTEPKQNWCTGFATSGCLDGLRYAHQKGCTWDENACCRAASNGHLEVLQYLRENGCPE